ncbi:MAG: hypothetical protein JWQ89_1584 [Devosia sp.]|nr:hypothetical protein [Devosia sp.]
METRNLIDLSAGTNASRSKVKRKQSTRALT